MRIDALLCAEMLRQLYDKFGREGLLPDDVGIDFDGMVQRPKAFPFREAMDVYREFFGGAKTPDLPTGTIPSPLPKNEFRVVRASLAVGGTLWQYVWRVWRVVERVWRVVGRVVGRV